MKAKPLGSKILIIIDDAEKLSEGGLVLPTTSQEVSCTGKVVAIGKDVIELVVNDHVTFRPYAASTTFTVEGLDVAVMDESEILCVLGESSDLDT